MRTARGVRGTDKTAVILAAGVGARLGELGRRHSKPMVPIRERPLIDWVIASLRAAGLARIIVVGHVHDAALRDFLATTHSDVGFVTQSERRGIADALRQALPLLAEEPAYLACACDSLFAADDVARLIALGERHAGCAVVGVLDMGAEATASRSAVRLDGGRIVEITEKPASRAAPSGLVAMPLYWLPQSMAPYIETVPAVGNEQYVSTALNEFIRAGGTVRAVRVGSRIEITTAADVERASAFLAKRRALTLPPLRGVRC